MARFRTDEERALELEDCENAAIGEGLSAGEVAAAVAEAANRVDLAIEWFAVLRDGRRIETDQQRHGQNELGTEFTRDDYTVEGLRDLIRWTYWRMSQPEDRWIRLRHALQQEGIECPEETLDRLPYAIEAGVPR